MSYLTGRDPADMSAVELQGLYYRTRDERDALRTILQRYIAAYPAFRMKPIGAEGSPARIEQENLMALEELAQAAIAKVTS